jgi:hypothetical protein
MRSKLEEITLLDRNAAEMEIRDNQKQINYDAKQYPVEILVQKYMEGINDRTNKLIIPDYQRELFLDDERQSKFIESVIFGRQIPYIFVVDIGHDENDEARLEIVDRTQRIITLTRFVNNVFAPRTTNLLPHHHRLNYSIRLILISLKKSPFTSPINPRKLFAFSLGNKHNLFSGLVGKY